MDSSPTPISKPVKTAKQDVLPADPLNYVQHVTEDINSPILEPNVKHAQKTANAAKVVNVSNAIQTGLLMKMGLV